MTAQGARPAKKRYSVIFHLDSGSKSVLSKTIANIRNMFKDPRLEGRLRAELVVNGMGYQIYEKSNGFGSDLEALAARGVIFALCDNTVRKLKINLRTLYPFVRIVPSAMGELVIREEDGWAYIHPSP